VEEIVLTSIFALTLIAGPAPKPLDDQAFFAILAETKVGRMAGMEMPDFSQLPPGIKLPPEAMMFSGKPTRILNIRLWSKGIAASNAAASVAPPSGLKQGDKLDLELYRPQAGDTGGKVKDFDPDSNPDKFTIKIYWGSSETVKEGQPKIFKWTDLGPDQQAAMKERARNARATASYFYKPDWTTGYWPTKKQAGQIDAAASLVGKYSLTTNYTGNVEIEAPSNVNFLDAIALSSPNLDKKVDLNKFIPLAWPQIPNALGQSAMIMGMEGKNTMIMWSSSEVYQDALMGDLGFMQMSEVKDFVAKTIFMAGDRTSVNVPAGIFANADFAMLNMAGYGPGAALETAQPLPRIQTKTSLMVMLGGKQMGFRP
jgi:hypothetical protein